MLEDECGVELRAPGFPEELVDTDKEFRASIPPPGQGRIDYTSKGRHYAMNLQKHAMAALVITLALTTLGCNENPQQDSSSNSRVVVVTVTEPSVTVTEPNPKVTIQECDVIRGRSDLNTFECTGSLSPAPVRRVAGLSAVVECRLAFSDGTQSSYRRAAIIPYNVLERDRLHQWKGVVYAGPKNLIGSTVSCRSHNSTTLIAEDESVTTTTRLQHNVVEISRCNSRERPFNYSINCSGTFEYNKDNSGLLDLSVVIECKVTFADGTMTSYEMVDRFPYSDISVGTKYIWDGNVYRGDKYTGGNRVSCRAND